MTKTETVIRSIFGAAGIDTRPLARAVDIAAELLFTHRQTIDELHFTRDIYSWLCCSVAKTGSRSR